MIQSDRDGVRPNAVAGLPARVLVVDDLEDSRALLGRRFSRRGYAVSHADGGAQALAQIADGEVDLVLLDIDMPELDGFEVLQRIRRTHGQQDLPVIMVTIYDDPENVRRALKLGANGFLSKPVDFDHAFDRVDAALEDRPQRRG